MIAVLAAIALDQWMRWISVHFPARKTTAERQMTETLNTGVKIILAALLIFTLVNNLLSYYLPDSPLISLNQENRLAMQWAQKNTEPDSRFLIIDFPSSWSTDLVSEWFPALALRKSLLTAQGEEWLPGNVHSQTIDALAELDACRLSGTLCLTQWSEKWGMQYEYVYFTSDAQAGQQPAQYTSVLEAQMFTDPGYKLAYQSEDVRIFQKK